MIENLLIIGEEIENEEKQKIKIELQDKNEENKEMEIEQQDNEELNEETTIEEKDNMINESQVPTKIENKNLTRLKENYIKSKIKSKKKNCKQNPA